LLRFALLFAVLAVMIGAPDARADRKTVCTITINSPDEKETLRRNLPDDQYEFVELVEPGRPDWFAAACRKAVRCDVLVVSGHFDDGTEFYSDRAGARESLPVETMERAACSDSCPSVFSQLKEVYLFGCNTLEAAPLKLASGEIARDFMRSGYSTTDAERLARELAERAGESNRDRMRHVFKDVPAIYGFSAKAPLGAAAGPALERYFRAGADGNFGSGRPSTGLVAVLAPASMTLASGVSDADADAAVRRDVCRLADDRLTSAQKLDFVHALLAHDLAEARMLLDRIERYVASLTPADRATPDVAARLAAIERDAETRARYLTLARDADEPAVRARMIELAAALGWLSPEARRAELQQMLVARLSPGSVGVADVELACSLNKEHALDLDPVTVAGGINGIARPAVRGAQHGDGIAGAAVLACLGIPEARSRMLRGLASANAADVEIAQTYLHHRPLAEATELRAVAASVLRMPGSDAQVRALETLAGYRFSDRETLQALTHLFSLAKSIDVQRAIAGVLIRSDYTVIASPQLARTLRAQRLKSPDGADVIDVLIRRLAS
jgi:hypothetical protein